MFFVLSIAVIAACAYLAKKFTPEEVSLRWMEEAFLKRTNKGEISFEAKHPPRQRQELTAHAHEFQEGGNSLLLNMRLSDLATMKSERSKPSDAGNFEELASRIHMDCVAVDSRRNIVAVLFAKSERADFTIQVPDSANIKCVRNQASFDAAAAVQGAR